MRITKKIFTDLAIYMMSLGVLIGFLFPFFCIIAGVPIEIVLTPVFFITCISAGLILGGLNILLAKKIVGAPIMQLSQKMKHIEYILMKRIKCNSEEYYSPDNYLIEVESEDELGECAESYNTLIKTLSELMEMHTELQQFSEMLTAHLELDTLSRETLIRLIKNMKADAGAILIEKNGELTVVAIESINDVTTLKNNKRVLKAMITHERQWIKLSKDIFFEDGIVDSDLNEMIIEPIVYKNRFIGNLVLITSSSFSTIDINNLSFLSHSLSLAFRNAITHKQIQELAALDDLTGLYNRRFGILRIREEFSRATRTNIPISILMFDIDHFKNINDMYGHLVGDRVLASIANTALASIRDGDILLRYGGEEFLCALPGANKTEANRVAERIRMMINDSVVQNDEQDIKVTISGGVATYPRNDVSDCDQLIKLADDAMYNAKKLGRNRTVSH